MKIFRRLLPLFLILALLTSLSACTKKPTEKQSSEEEKNVTEVANYLKTSVNAEALNEYISFETDISEKKYESFLFCVDKDNYLIMFSPNINYAPKSNEPAPDKLTLFRYNVPTDKTTKIYSSPNPPAPEIYLFSTAADGSFFIYGAYHLLSFDKNFDLEHTINLTSDVEYDSLKAISPDGQNIVLVDNKKLYIAELSDTSKRTELSELNFMRDVTFSKDGTKVFQPVHSQGAYSLIGMEYVDIITGENKKLTCFTEGEFNGMGAIYPYDETHMLVTVLQEGEYVGEGDLHFFLVDYENDTRQELFMRPTCSGAAPQILPSSKGIYTHHRSISENPVDFIEFELFNGETFYFDFEDKRIRNYALSENGESVFVIYENKDSENGFEAVIYTKK